MKELTKEIEKSMKTLSLKGMLEVYKDLALKASQGNLQYEEYLALLLEAEVKRKTEGSVKAKITKARFPYFKTIEEFDFSFQPHLNEKEVINLSSLDFLDKKENILFLGPPGVGKTHLSIGLGIKACMAKYRVVFMQTQRLLEELMICQRDGSLMDKLMSYSRLHLLVIDELGYMPVTREQANLLFQLISVRYERGSIILTSNYNFDEWGKIFDDTVVASAILDRLVHHSRIIKINQLHKIINKSLI